jgi:hypothetical protein
MHIWRKFKDADLDLNGIRRALTRVSNFIAEFVRKMSIKPKLTNHMHHLL